VFKKYWTASTLRYIFAIVAKTRKDVIKVYQVVRNGSNEVNSRAAHQGLPLRCLSRVTVNCHARFLKGNGAAKPLSYLMGQY